jgi:uncharacterized OB-fold protein
VSDAVAQGAVEASLCCACGKHVVPRRPLCPKCGGATRNVAVGGRGTILSWTTVHVTPEGVPSPRTVSLVGLECGAAVLCLVADDRTLEMGASAEIVLVDGLFHMK